MKQFSILVFAVLFVGITFGQEVKREKVKRITQADKSLAWYQTQKRLWKIETDKNPKSEEAWWNYYEAFRGELHKSGGNPFTKESPVMKIVNEMEKHIPNTFTFYHCKANQVGKGTGYEKYLMKAYEMQPNNPLTYENLIVYYEMHGNLAKRKEIVSKLYKYGDISIGLLNYGYNILNSVDKDGILITAGDNDTYPLWVLQDVFGIRTDVFIVNRWMIKDNDYLKVILKQCRANYQPNELKKLAIEDIHKFTPQDHTNHTKNFIQFISNKTKNKVYLAAGAWQKGLYGMADYFYNVGLAWQYSTTDVDNIAIMKRNFFKRYRMDDILHSFYKESKPEIMKYPRSNYAPGLLTIYNHAKESENLEELNWTRKYLEKILEESTPEMKKAINFYLNQK